MADNVNITPGTGATVAADDIGGALYQRVKVVIGADGVNNGDVSTSNKLPVTDSVAQASLNSIDGKVATADNQSAANTSLSSIDSKLPALVGGKVPVDGSVSVIGGATEAKQDAGNTSLGAIDSKTPTPVNGRVPVDGSAVTQPVAVASLPLPTGAATAANQATANTSLFSIDGKLPALGQALASASVPVALPATQITALTPPSTVASTQSGTWNINNISGSIVLPTGAATAAKQDAGNTSLSAIDTKLGQFTFASNRAMVDGSGVTQPISAASLPLPSGAATAANQTTSNTSLNSIAGSVALPTSRTMYSFTMASADTQYGLVANASVVLTGAKKVILSNLLGTTNIRYAYVTGRVGSSTPPFRTIPPGAERIIEYAIPSEIFIASGAAGTAINVEVEA